MLIKQAIKYLQLNQVDGGLTFYASSWITLMNDLLKYQSFLLTNSKMPTSIEEFNAFAS